MKTFYSYAEDGTTQFTKQTKNTSNFRLPSSATNSNYLKA